MPPRQRLHAVACPSRLSLATPLVAAPTHDRFLLAAARPSPLAAPSLPATRHSQLLVAARCLRPLMNCRRSPLAAVHSHRHRSSPLPFARRSPSLRPLAPRGCSWLSRPLAAARGCSLLAATRGSPPLAAARRRSTPLLLAARRRSMLIAPRSCRHRLGRGQVKSRVRAFFDTFFGPVVACLLCACWQYLV